MARTIVEDPEPLPEGGAFPHPESPMPLADLAGAGVFASDSPSTPERPADAARFEP